MYRYKVHVSLCYTDVADNSPEAECDTIRDDVTEDVTSQRDDIAAAESTSGVSEDDDVTHVSETENHPCTQTATVDASSRSPEPTTEIVCASSPERPSKPTKFIDRRTETLISACATVSTSAVNDADVTRDTSDVIDKSESNKQMTSPVSRLAKHRDRKFDVSTARDCRRLGIVNDVSVHRSMLARVPATTTTAAPTTTSVNVLRAPASLTVQRPDWPQRDTNAAVTCSATTPVTSPCSAESRLTVTLAESTSQPSHRNCRLITRTTPAPSKPLDIAESDSEGVNDDVSSRPAAVQSPVSSHRPRLRSRSSSERSAVANGDAESSKSTRPRSSVCVLALLSPVTVQPTSAPVQSTSPARQVPTTSSVSSAAAADATSSTTMISRLELITSPVPLSPVKVRFSSASTSGRQPATAPSPSRHELDPRAKTDGVSVMTALDDALAMLTSVVTEDSQPQNNQPHLPSTAVHDERGVMTPTAVQAPCVGKC